MVGNHKIVNLDALTYAGNLENLQGIKSKNYKFVKGDVRNSLVVCKEMKDSSTVVHFAAESHVDRSITKPETFIDTNIYGTYVMLEEARKSNIKKFIYISTDEVYGPLKAGFADEDSAFRPTSPYSASKASADLLVQSYYKTYGLPTIVIRLSNCFGPYQYPEKLIPLFVTNLLEDRKIPIYGSGLQKRDWLYVKDACEATAFLCLNGKLGEAYNISGGNERVNLALSKLILQYLNKDESYIEYVKDRPGHDFRYAMDDTKIKRLGWEPKHDFDSALKETIEWYLQNKK